MIFSKICFFRKNLHQILSKFEKRYTWLKSNPWPPDQFFMIFWWFSRNLASFRNFRLIFWEIFQICAPVISRSTQQNHFKFLSELSESLFCGTQQTAHEFYTQKKSFNFRKKKRTCFTRFSMVFWPTLIISETCIIAWVYVWFEFCMSTILLRWVWVLDIFEVFFNELIWT